MAYSNYFPASYQPMYPQGFNPYIQQQAAQQSQQPQQIQNGGLVTVRSKTDAQNYPVAPGNSVTFKDESAPYVYVKTMGFSQLDRPTFEIFRLVREEEAAESTRSDESEKGIDLSDYALKTDLVALREDFDALREEMRPKSAKKKGEKDE